MTTIKAAFASDFRYTIFSGFFGHNKEVIRDFFIWILRSYASGARDVVIVHHWAGYPKRKKRQRKGDAQYINNNE